MTMQITKYVLPVVSGAIAGMLLILFGEIIIGKIFPIPPGADNSPESIAIAIKNTPDKAFYLLLVNYAFCSFAAGIVASLVMKRSSPRPAFGVGVVLTLAGLYNILEYPQPMWFSVFNLFLYIPMAYLGYLVVRKPADKKILQSSAM